MVVDAEGLVRNTAEGLSYAAYQINEAHPLGRSRSGQQQDRVLLFTLKERTVSPLIEEPMLLVAALHQAVLALGRECSSFDQGSTFVGSLCVYDPKQKQNRVITANVGNSQAGFFMVTKTTFGVTRLCL